MKSLSLLFLPRFGRRHRLVGFTFLCILLIGAYDITYSSMFNTSYIEKEYQLINNYFYYDILLGCTGILLTYTAAFDFKNAHSNIVNPTTIKSGTLHKSAIVSFNEMIEHSFYQILKTIKGWNRENNEHIITYEQL